MDYYENPNISASLLKACLKGYGGYQQFISSEDKFNLSYKKDRNVLLGSLVDCKLTDRERLNRDFVVVNLPTTSDQMKKMAERAIEYRDEYIDTVLKSEGETIKLTEYARALDWEEFVLRAAMDHDINYGNGKFTSTRIVNDFKKKGGHDYMEELSTVDGRIIVSEEDSYAASELAGILETHPNSSGFFGNYSLYQEELYGRLQLAYFKNKVPSFINVDAKGKPDILIPNTSYTNNLKIGKFEIPPRSILPVDIKVTTDSTARFPYHARKLRIDIQASWYKELLVEDKKIELYVLNPLIIGISEIEKKPFWFQCNNIDLSIAMHGASKTIQYMSEGVVFTPARHLRAGSGEKSIFGVLDALYYLSQYKKGNTTPYLSSEGEFIKLKNGLYNAT